ncbi:MAG: iron-containing alcohol dehydrogenase [Candidatus Cyclobacteriaceae bacterium M3_2C_046]
MEKVFSFKMSDKLIMENGAVSLLPTLIRETKARKPFIVTDPGLVKAGLLQKVQHLLAKHDIDFISFSQVEADPRIEIVYEALELARESSCDLVIGLGGGSSLDIAKIVAIMVHNHDPLDQYIGIGNIPGPGIPTIMIPTTAGTGSEVTPIVVLSDKKEQLKKGVVSDYLYPTVALIDPSLALTLPPYVTAYTGIDALTHAVEAYTNKFAHPFVDTFALKAIELIAANLITAVNDGQNLNARYNMALASLYGGLCLGSVNTAAVHALAYPLGGMFDVPHGVANSLLLPYVIEFNSSHCAERYGKIAEAMGVDTTGMDKEYSAKACIGAVQDLCQQAGIIQKISQLEVPENTIDKMATAAMKVTRLLNNNPKPVSLDDARKIYQNAF